MRKDEEIESSFELAMLQDGLWLLMDDKEKPVNRYHFQDYEDMEQSAKRISKPKDIMEDIFSYPQSNRIPLRNHHRPINSMTG